MIILLLRLSLPFSLSFSLSLSIPDSFPASSLDERKPRIMYHFLQQLAFWIVMIEGEESPEHQLEGEK